MKKENILAALIFCLFYFHASSQSTASYGFKVGLSFGNSEAKDFTQGYVELDSKFRTSFYLGAYVEYPLENLSENLFTQLELQYVNSGSKIEASQAGPESLTRIGQLNLPFLLKYRVAEPFIITAGIYWGLVLNVEEEEIDGNGVDSTEDFETFDSGLIIGAEVPISEHVYLEARYNHGLLDIMDLEKTENRGSYFNRFVQLGVGIRL